MKKIHVLGGGTNFHVRPHLALSAPASGKTALALVDAISYWQSASEPLFEDCSISLHLTRMARPASSIDTNADVEKLVDEIIADPDSRVVFFSTALCDFEGHIMDVPSSPWVEGTTLGGFTSAPASSIYAAPSMDGNAVTVKSEPTPSGKDQPRLKSREGVQYMALTPASKVIGKIRETRKDIFLVGFKTTAGATEDEQFDAGLKLCKEAHCNLVLANDLHTRMNMIITPEQARYTVTTDRKRVLFDLVEIAGKRSRGTFARCRVEDGELYDFNSPEIPESLRHVVQYCVDKGAYLPFNGKCVGHFAVKKPDGSVLCSIRRSNYNSGIKMVRMITLNERETVAYGARPSAGSRSQWIMFNRNPSLDCVVHFHCPLKLGKSVSVRPQKFNECGSNECGVNTALGLEPVTEDGAIYAVMLDNHGPNVLFNSGIDPSRVTAFIEENFDLSKTTRGYQTDKA